MSLQSSAYSDYLIGRGPRWSASNSSRLGATFKFRRSTWGGFTKLHGQVTGRYAWAYEEEFVSPEDAIDCIQALMKHRAPHHSHVKMWVCDQKGNPVWHEQTGWASSDKAKIEFLELSLEVTINTPQEVNMDGQLAAPLHIEREALIEALQVNLDKEQEARQAAQDALSAREKEATDALQTLDPDEILNLVRSHVSSDLGNIVEMVDEAKKSGRLKSKEVLPNSTESALVRTVRVLTLANDTEIEVKNTDAIYPLL